MRRLVRQLLALGMLLGLAAVGPAQQISRQPSAPEVQAALDAARTFKQRGNAPAAISTLEAANRLPMADEDRFRLQIRLILLHRAAGHWPREVELASQTARLDVDYHYERGQFERGVLKGTFGLSERSMRAREFENALFVLRREHHLLWCGNGIATAEQQRREKIVICLLHLGWWNDARSAMQRQMAHRCDFASPRCVELTCLAYDRAGQRDDLARLVGAIHDPGTRNSYQRGLDLLAAADGDLEDLIALVRARLRPDDLTDWIRLDEDSLAAIYSLALVARRGPEAVAAIERSYRKRPENAGTLLLALGDTAGSEAEALLLDIGRNCPRQQLPWVILALQLRGAAGVRQSAALLAARGEKLTREEDVCIEEAGHSYFLSTRWPAPPRGSLPK